MSYAVEQIVAEQSYSYEGLLKAIAKEGCVKEVLAGDFIRKYRLRAASSVSAALKKRMDTLFVIKVRELRT